ILDDETVKAHLGLFTPADCERVWRDSVYAEMHPELLALMQNFELCYLLADARPPTLLAPQLLPPAKPNALENWGEPEDLARIIREGADFAASTAGSYRNVPSEACGDLASASCRALRTMWSSRTGPRRQLRPREVAEVNGW
ncbi:MAG TPA: COR domain-containing protein, partial [Vicinamibacterales bacterium]|nr:COR domain-containing protein [Vicinamibacterales bacterium]